MDLRCSHITQVLIDIFLNERAIIDHLTNFCSINSTTNSQKYTNCNLAVKMVVGEKNIYNTRI